jgi:hypothetical protein
VGAVGLERTDEDTTEYNHHGGVECWVHTSKSIHLLVGVWEWLPEGEEYHIVMVTMQRKYTAAGFLFTGCSQRVVLGGQPPFHGAHCFLGSFIPQFSRTSRISFDSFTATL